MISPFGFVYNGCCGRERTKVKNKIKSNANDQNSNFEQRIKELEKFKVFLKDYVVDFPLIDDVTSAQEGVDNDK